MVGTCWNRGACRVADCFALDLHRDLPGWANRPTLGTRSQKIRTEARSSPSRLLVDHLNTGKFNLVVP